jgi:hypothetical protein
MNAGSNSQVAHASDCDHCGEVIGAYESAVWATDDGRAVIGSPVGVDSRDLRPSVAALVHLACWNELLARSSTEPVKALDGIQDEVKSRKELL